MEYSKKLLQPFNSVDCLGQRTLHLDAVSSYSNNHALKIVGVHKCNKLPIRYHHQASHNRKGYTHHTRLELDAAPES